MGIPDPMEGPVFPNTPPPPHAGTENVSQPENAPDNTMNTLLKLITTVQALKGQGGQATTDTGANWLLRKPPVSSDRWRLQVPEIEPVVAPGLPETTSPNALLRPDQAAPTTAPVPEKSANSLLDYWKKPVIGNLPLDQFVQLAGTAAHAIAPREWSGRLGAGLAQMGGAAYGERVRREREEPTNILRRRLLEAQIAETEKKIGEEKIPTTWEAYYKAEKGTIDEETGKPKTIGKILKSWHGLDRVPKEPSHHYVVDNEGNVSTFADGKLISGSGKGAAKTEPKEGEHYEVDDQGRVSFYKGGKLVSGPGKGKTKAPPTSAGEKLTMTDIKSAYSMDIGNIKNQMMIDMTPDEQISVSGQPGENILALLLSGRVGKSLSPEKKEMYIRKLQEVEKTYSDLTNQVLGRKGAKIPPKSPGARPELAVSHGQPQEVPEGSKLIGKSKKTGNPVYELPDGSTKEFRP